MAKQITSLRFDNQVALITGASTVTCQAIAIELARRGARIVLHDFIEQDPSVVSLLRDIHSFNIYAVACYYSTSQVSNIIKFATENFEKIDIVINNSEFTTAKNIEQISTQELAENIQNHLKFTVDVTRCVWPLLRKQKFGRIVNISNDVSLFGDFNKLADVVSSIGMNAFSQIAGKEGEKYGVKVNTIVPIHANPLNIKSLVSLTVLLAHKNTHENGSTYQAGSGYVSKLRIQRANGLFFKTDFTAEDFKSNFSALQTFKGPYDYPSTFTDSLIKILKLLDDSGIIPKPKL